MPRASNACPTTLRQSRKSDLDSAIRFAIILGVRNITSDPTGDILKYVDERMTAEKLSFGIHNHFLTRKFAYESPEDIMNATLSPVAMIRLMLFGNWHPA
jgi:hypothetical protein